MARKLKVFCYSDGFHSWTVAAPSRAKALEAWGVKRDLFSDGAAKEIDIGPDREAALASPGELIERGLAVDVGAVARKTAPKAKKPEPSDAKAKARVEALEAKAAALDEAQAEELAKRQAKARNVLAAKLKAARAKVSG
ncbi:MAG: hypothetical protein QME55_05355 [Brevundimonas sp.]|uniref:hypothetical protein n=1 Tax=Brevundimonas sp. TaxID=1871086 RepID=UPI002613FFF8|nr:hypothetical protein [Brevundimonas sp.]MDI6624139.1 hypothetical protein [Brevundimonas sp.]MDQ7811684.1 hypothetical protein [Brevundimonas sp.]